MLHDPRWGPLVFSYFGWRGPLADIAYAAACRMIAVNFVHYECDCRVGRGVEVLTLPILWRDDRG